MKRRRVMAMIELDSEQSVDLLRRTLRSVLAGLPVALTRVIQLQLDVIREPEPKRQLRRAHRRGRGER